MPLLTAMQQPDAVDAVAANQQFLDALSAEAREAGALHDLFRPAVSAAMAALLPVKSALDVPVQPYLLLQQLCSNAVLSEVLVAAPEFLPPAALASARALEMGSLLGQCLRPGTMNAHVVEQHFSDIPRLTMQSASSARAMLQRSLDSLLVRRRRAPAAAARARAHTRSCAAARRMAPTRWSWRCCGRGRARGSRC